MENSNHETNDYASSNWLGVYFDFYVDFGVVAMVKFFKFWLFAVTTVAATALVFSAVTAAMIYIIIRIIK